MGTIDSSSPGHAHAELGLAVPLGVGEGPEVGPDGIHQRLQEQSAHLVDDHVDHLDGVGAAPPRPPRP